MRSVTPLARSALAPSRGSPATASGSPRCSIRYVPGPMPSPAKCRRARSETGTACRGSRPDFRRVVHRPASAFRWCRRSPGCAMSRGDIASLNAVRISRIRSTWSAFDARVPSCSANLRSLLWAYFMPQSRTPGSLSHPTTLPPRRALPHPERPPPRWQRERSGSRRPSAPRDSGGRPGGTGRNVRGRPAW